MGVVDAPQWLLPAYVRSVRALGASAPVEEIRRAGERLVAMWSTPDRRFHTLRHAIDMLARVDELADESHNPEVMRLAAWYHGCVFSAASEQTYRRNGGEDEVASAAYAAEDLAALGVPERITDRVCALILNLKRHDLGEDDIDALALSDADLGALAVEPQQYKRYRELVREEYAHIPQEDYLRARLAIVSRLLERESLFSSPLGARWEAPARQNLQAERQRLLDGIARLPPAPTAPTGTPVPAPAPPSAPTGETADAQPHPEDPQAEDRSAAPDRPAPDPSPAARPPRARTEDQQVAAEADPRAHEHSHLGGLELAGEGDEPRTAARPPRPAPPPSRGGTTAASPEDPQASPGRRSTAQAVRRPGAQEGEELSYTTSMESCVEDLDRLLGSRRGETGSDRVASAASQREILAERLRAKAEQAQEAKALRGARSEDIEPAQPAHQSADEAAPAPQADQT